MRWCAAAVLMGLVMGGCVGDAMSPYRPTEEVPEWAAYVERADEAAERMVAGVNVAETALWGEEWEDRELVLADYERRVK